MTDPIAEAAAQQAQAQIATAEEQAAPSLLDQAMNTIHDLEAKVEGLMHPNAAGGASPEGTSSPADSVPAVSVLGEGEVGNAVEGAAPSSAASDTLPSSAPAAGEQEQQAAGGEEVAVAHVDPTISSASSTESASSESSDPNAALKNIQWTPEPYAAAPAAASQPESVISSSVSDVSHAVDTLAASASADRERARVAIDHLRAHLWTFTGDSVAKLHSELDKIEAFFK